MKYTRYNHYGIESPKLSGWVRWGLPITIWVVLISVWWFVLPGHVDPLKFPTLQSVYASAQQMGVNLLWHTLATVWRTGSGLFVGGFLGVLMAFLMYRFPMVNYSASSIIEVIRPLPPLALTIFIVLWFQLSPLGPLVLVAEGAFLIMVISTQEALEGLPIELKRASWSLGITGARFYRRVLLPAVLPHLIAPARLACALAVSLATAAEIFGQQYGLGFVLVTARRSLNTETIMLVFIMLALVAALYDLAIQFFMRHLTRWNKP